MKGHKGDAGECLEGDRVVVVEGTQSSDSGAHGDADAGELEETQ